MWTVSYSATDESISEQSKRYEGVRFLLINMCAPSAHTYHTNLLNVCAHRAQQYAVAIRHNAAAHSSTLDSESVCDAMMRWHHDDAIEPAHTSICTNETHVFNQFQSAVNKFAFHILQAAQKQKKLKKMRKLHLMCVIARAAFIDRNKLCRTDAGHSFAVDGRNGQPLQYANRQWTDTNRARARASQNGLEPLDGVCVCVCTRNQTNHQLWPAIRISERPSD